MSHFTLEIFIHPGCVAFCFFFCQCDKIPWQKQFREKGFILALSSKVGSIVAGKAGPQELEPAVHMVPIVRKRSWVQGDAQLILHWDSSNPCLGVARHSNLHENNQDNPSRGWKDDAAIRTLTALLEDKNLTDSTHMGQLTATCNSSSQGSDNLFWPPRTYTWYT